MKLSNLCSGLALVVAVGTAGFVGYNQTTHGSAAPMSSAAIDQQIHNYLLDNPQIAMQMLQKLRQQEIQKMQAAASGSSKVVLANHAKFTAGAHAISQGAKNAPITVVEFFDYQCSACAGTYPEMEKFLATDFAKKNVRVVYRPFPFFGPASVYAAKAVIAAEAQGKSMDLHNALFKSGLIEHKLKISDVDAMAKKIPGINMAQLKKDINSSWVQKEMQINAALVKSLNLLATPALIFTPTSNKLANAKNTKFINSGMPAQTIAANVKAVLQNTK
jgi:protein-disulfide isomerase